MLKIASWNVNSLRVRLPHVLRWLDDVRPDLLGLQETKTIDENFPKDELAAVGYDAIFSGQKTYNGVAILSRLDRKPTDIETDLPGLDDPQRRLLAATYGGVRMINIYVPNGSEIGSEKYAYKMAWLDKLIAYTKKQLKAHEKLFIVGDFNIAPEDRDVHDPEAWQGSVLVSEAERAAFQKLLKVGLTDTFRLFEHRPDTFSWWDYRAASFQRNRGLRIDHILMNSILSRRCLTSIIDHHARAWERPSDHAPVMTTVAMKAGKSVPRG